MALGLLSSVLYIIKITSILRLCVLLFVVRGYVAGVAVVVWLQDTGMASIRRVRRMLALPLGAVIPVEVDFRQGVEDFSQMILLLQRMLLSFQFPRVMQFTKKCCENCKPAGCRGFSVV